ncbi:acyltransferase [Flavobacterium sp. LT1R49]|uniref:acyltransferase n=1 Tax=Flavobacterium arabinosi TaxID=3398737 RepID=UPI003A89799F
MNPTTIGLFFNKLNYFSNKFRIIFFKIKGLQVKKGTRIGKISCEWLNNLFVGSDCDIQNNVDFRIGSPFNKECNITIGDRVFIGRCCEFVCSTKIKIGNDCFIASNTTINDTGHEYAKHIKIKDQPITTAKITIEDDVWIGTSSVILQGITIGKGAIIGAGSVVNKSIPEYEIGAGVPARFIKKRI